MKKFPRTDAATNRGQRGAVMLESTIIFPVLFMLFMGVIDLSRYFMQYSKISLIAYEGARYGSSRPLLETGSYGPAADGSKSVHQKIHDRVGVLLQRQNGLSGQAQIVTRFNPAVSENSVEVSLEVPFNSVFPLLSPLAAVRVSARAPYLIDAV